MEKQLYFESPVINVGILTASTVRFSFSGEYHAHDAETVFTGEQEAVFTKGKIRFQNSTYEEITFLPSSLSHSFLLHDVTIGVDFHWQRTEDQRFQGILKLLSTPKGIVIINIIPIEEYLTSVISSEMSATASKEFLKAHAVISRSWLLAQLEKNIQLAEIPNSHCSYQVDEKEMVRWYDREDHTLFDVCADDHCQRYQGITRASRPLVREVIEETKGEILLYEGGICDTRFSKCCGGITEEFESCWEPIHHPYLTVLRDSKANNIPDLTQEPEAIQWIHSSPDAFCNTTDKEILSQVLNNYDQETTDFYRWEKEYSQQELSTLIKKKSGIDFGEIIDIIPLKRGVSGRIEKLQIIGTKRTYIIGKELEIRRTLSETHLYSSAFTIEKISIENNIPQQFLLTGAGWGHGVGLCQIGAAVMGATGYTYQEILNHYFIGAEIKKAY